MKWQVDRERKEVDQYVGLYLIDQVVSTNAVKL